MCCYMMAVVLLLWAMLVVAGLDPKASLPFFLVAEFLAGLLHIREMKMRFQHLRDYDWW